MEKREETSSAHKRSASLSSPQNMGAKRKPEPEDMTPGAQGKKPKDKNQNGLPLAQKLLQDFRIDGEDAEEDVKVDVEEGAKLDKNQNSLPTGRSGPAGPMASRAIKILSDG